MRTARAPVLVLAALGLALLCPRPTPAATKLPPLDGVIWEGAGASFEQLRGKTVLVLTYVTWCPICNGWSPAMLSQLRDAIQDKPVIVMAVSTDTPAAKAKDYMQQRGFVGPNILQGYDPKLAKQFGFENEFFNFAIVGPQGHIQSTGNAGSYYGDKDHKQFVVAKEFEKISDLGKFRFVDPKMSVVLQDLLWPMELGYVAEVSRSVNKAEKTLKPADREKLKTVMERFLDDELKAAQELATGEASDKIEALDKASLLSKNFAAAPQGKEAKKVLAELIKDKALKKELSAKKMYDQSMQTVDLDRRVALLEKAAKQFPDTHYGELAGQAARATK